MSHVSATHGGHDYKHSTAPDRAEAHPAAAFDPRLEMGLIAASFVDNGRV